MRGPSHICICIRVFFNENIIFILFHSCDIIGLELFQRYLVVRFTLLFLGVVTVVSSGHTFTLSRLQRYRRNSFGTILHDFALFDTCNTFKTKIKFILVDPGFLCGEILLVNRYRLISRLASIRSRSLDGVVDGDAPVLALIFEKLLLTCVIEVGQIDAIVSNIVDHRLESVAVSIDENRLALLLF